MNNKELLQVFKKYPVLKKAYRTNSRIFAICKHQDKSTDLFIFDDFQECYYDLDGITCFKKSYLVFTNSVKGLQKNTEILQAKGYNLTNVFKCLMWSMVGGRQAYLKMKWQLSTGNKKEW